MCCKWFVCVCLLLVSIGCGVDTTEKPKEVATWSSKPQSLGCGSDSAGCANDAQCAQFAQCQTGGWVACSNGRCSGFQPQSYDIDCILKSSCNGSVNTGGSGGSPPGNGTCGPVTPPPELLSHDANDANCNFAEGMRPNEDQYRAWLQFTADQPNSTVTVHSLSSYCLNSNGTFTPLGGTAKGEAAITWGGHFRRDTWYNPSGPVTTVTLNGNNTYPVPNNPLLLHLGNGGLSHGCQYIVLKAVISTTGDAKGELGIDGYVGNSWSHEIGVSGWKSCTTGQVTLVTPWGNNKTCDDIGGGSTPPPANKNPCDGVADGTTQSFGGATLLGECRAGKRLCSNGTWIVLEQPFDGLAETCDGKDNDCDGAIDNGNVCGPLNNCPATGIKITPGPALLNPCPSLITKTWGMGGKQYTSAPGQPLIITDYWTGYAYFETVCNGQEGSWPPGVTNAQAGFAEVCTQGQNVTNNTFVCWDKYSSKYRPTVPLSPSGAGFCP